MRILYVDHIRGERGSAQSRFGLGQQGLESTELLEVRASLRFSMDLVKRRSHVHGTVVQTLAIHQPKRQSV